MTQNIISSQLENKDSTAIQNTSDISNADYIQSCVTPQKQNHSVQATSTITHLTPLITNLRFALLKLTKIIELPQLVRNICVSRLTANLLMLLSV